MSYLDENKPSTSSWHSPRQRSAPPVWWRPPARQVLRQMNWWWALLPSALAGLVMLGIALAHPHAHPILWWLGVKLLVLTAAVPLVAWQHLQHKAIRLRQDPFCIHCGWTLQGLPREGRCPECGRPYRTSVVDMFRRDPQWVKAYWNFDGRPPKPEVFYAQHREGNC